ncbi:MAG: hypothetical protein WC150_13670 [Bacteroidia bacterium]
MKTFCINSSIEIEVSYNTKSKTRARLYEHITEYLKDVSRYLHGRPESSSVSTDTVLHFVKSQISNLNSQIQEFDGIENIAQADLNRKVKNCKINKDSLSIESNLIDIFDFRLNHQTNIIINYESVVYAVESEDVDKSGNTLLVCYQKKEPFESRIQIPKNSNVPYHLRSM